MQTRRVGPRCSPVADQRRSHGRRAVLAGALLAAVVTACGGDDGAPGQDTEVVAVDLERGAELFAANCAVCHGVRADGATIGPPLVHELYAPDRHDDTAFARAVAEGAPQQHWEFGPMPAISGLDGNEVADIRAYVRALQREAGIVE